MTPLGMSGILPRMTDTDPRDDLPPYPDQFRNPDGTTSYDQWREALAVWRGADTENNEGPHAET